MSPASAADPVLLSVSELTLSRGGRRLFAPLSFVVPPGEALLVTGPNGAGKTSLLLALAGLLRPEGGSIGFGGAGERPPLHLLLPRPGLKARLGVAENLRFWQAVNGAGGLAVEPALARVGLGGLGDIEAGHLSTGQLRRLALARLLVTPRPLWLLDEPTAALDTEGQALVARLIDDHCATGGIVVAATHDALALTVPHRAITLARSP